MVLLAGAAFFYFELYRYISLQSLKTYQGFLTVVYHDYPFMSITVYMTAFIVMAAVSIPGCAVMMLAGGAVFGLSRGIIAASFALAIGGTFAFLAARFFFRGYVQRHFAVWLHMVNKEIERDGAFYLLSLRLMPAFPYFLLNLLMALTPIKTRVFYFATQIGMLPVTIVYVNAGTQLASIESAEDIFSPALIGSFALLAVFPWIARGLVALIRKREKIRKLKKPGGFHHSIAFLAGGSAHLFATWADAPVLIPVP